MSRTESSAHCAITIASLIVAAFVSACDADGVGEFPADPCGGWTADPQKPGAACTKDEDCGDPGVCIHAGCKGGACAYEFAPSGMQCAQCNVFGTCDGAGMCVSMSNAMANMQ